MATDTEALSNDEVHVDPDNIQDVELGDADGDGHQDGGPKPPTPEVDVVRQLAEKAGWKPKDQWTGATEGWTDASEFLANALTKGMEGREKLKRASNALRKMEYEARSRSKAAIDAEIRAAAKAGDDDRVIELTNEKARVEEHPAVVGFRERNDWFGVDPEATAYVEALDKRFAAESPDGVTDAKAHMQRIEAAVLKRFPEYALETPAVVQRRQAPHTARTSAAMRNDGGKKTEASLTSEEVSAFNQLKAAGMVKDRKEYVAQLNAAKERENA